MDFQILSSFFIRGDIPGAMAYMADYPELQPQLEAYRDIFEKQQYLHYDIPEVLNRILLEYQVYYRDVFYCREPEEQAAEALLARLRSQLALEQTTEAELAAQLLSVFEENGYHLQTGKSNGHYGPYVWKETIPLACSVELPEGEQDYCVNLLRGFVMRSWMDYLTFGQFGTKGWAGPDGQIYCIEKATDFDSETFRVSLLKHEAQHVMDMARWPGIRADQLEYRAKLVELIYSENAGLLQKFCSEAAADRPDDSHACAAFAILQRMGELSEGAVERIQARAAELFARSSRGLDENGIHTGEIL